MPKPVQVDLFEDRSAMVLDLAAAKLRAMVLDLGVELPPEAAEGIEALTAQLVELIAELPLRARVAALNLARIGLHRASPFRYEPTDLVLWFPEESVGANDYNPNTVFPPEMTALNHSIEKYGVTMPLVGTPIVASEPETTVRIRITDGFHRHLVGRNNASVHARMHGHLPLSLLGGHLTDADVKSATLLMNLARGSHDTKRSIEITASLDAAGWSAEQICVGAVLSSEELVRQRQVGGAAANLKSAQLGRAWTFDKPAAPAEASKPPKARKPRAKKASTR